MNITAVFLLCVGTVASFLSSPAFACDQKLLLQLQADQPFIRVPVNNKAELKCCYTPTHNPNQTWVIRTLTDNNVNGPSPVGLGPRVAVGKRNENHGSVCHLLTLTQAQLNDTGFYQCLLYMDQSCQYSHGTYLQVYSPLRRTLDISESWKNSIITIEGVLLLFAVLIPGMCQLGKTKRFTQLKRKKQREEENIYEGLNLDDCNSTYHQIQRAHRHGLYQDVASSAEHDTQLEKP